MKNNLLLTLTLFPPLSIIVATDVQHSTCKDFLDVAIVGSGPGGLSAAIALSKLPNIEKINIFERASAFRPIGAALTLNTLAYEALKDLDEKVHDHILKLGSNPKHHILQRPSGEILFNDESMFYETDVHWMAWYDLQTALKGFLPSDKVSIQLNSKLVDFHEDEENGVVSLSFENGDIVKTRMLIGADGYKSVVREKTVGDGKPIYTGAMTWRGVMDRSYFDSIVDMQEFHDMKDDVNLFICGNGMGFWVMDCGSGKIAWTGNALYENENPSSESTTTVITRALEVFKTWPSIIETLVRSTEETAIVESGVYDRDPVTSWGVSNGRYKRSTLLGDAAHPMRPALGLGGTMAFHDSSCLAKKLSGIDMKNTEEVAMALKAYEKERIATTTPIIIKSREVGQFSNSEKDVAGQYLQRLETSLEDRKKLRAK